MPGDHDGAARGSARPTSFPRRTILAGAAWSVPAIALATAVPAYAASNDTNLAFDKASYNTTSCGAISGAYVSATASSQPQTGVAVTVTVADGYTFADGSTSSTGTTDGSGRYTVPDIYVPDRGGSGSAVATSGSSSNTASASLSSPEPSTFVVAGSDYSGTYGALNDVSSNIPAGSTPAVGDWFLGADNVLRQPSGRGVKSGVARVGPAIQGSFGYVHTNGEYGWTKADDSMSLTASGIPSGCDPVGGDWFLHPDGRVFDSNASVVTTGVAQIGLANNVGFAVVRKSGELGYYDFNLQYHVANAAVPSGSKPASGAWFLTSNGDIVAGDTGATVATGVDVVGPPVQDWFGLILTSGQYAYFDDNGQYHAAGQGIPSKCSPVGRDWFLARDGRLFDGSGAVKYTGIGQVARQRNTKNPMGFAEKPGC